MNELFVPIFGVLAATVAYFFTQRVAMAFARILAIEERINGRLQRLHDDKYENHTDPFPPIKQAMQDVLTPPSYEDLSEGLKKRISFFRREVLAYDAWEELEDILGIGAHAAEILMTSAEVYEVHDILTNEFPLGRKDPRLNPY